MPRTSIAFLAGLWACTPADEPPSTATETPTETETAFGDQTPLFVVAGQSNAEGNVRLAGLEAMRDALPAHSDPLSASERAAARDAFRAGVGDWCNPTEDYSDDVADAAIDALRDGGLDLSGVSASYTLSGASMAAYRYRFQEATETLGDPYESTQASPHPAHTTEIGALGPGYGVWDDAEPDVLFYGPELGFGMHFDQLEGPDAFEVIKVAMGGSSLYAHWAPDGPMRDKLYAQTDSYLADRPETAVAGLIWFQGFNDQFEDAAIISYADNLTQLIHDFRSAYGQDTPVVVVQARRAGGLSDIADAQAAVASSVEGVRLAESDGLSDCFHYDAASQLVVGQRAAVALLDLGR